MSEEKESEALGTNCASCGKAEIDGIKLKDCDGCDLIRYCSDECQEDHKLEHEEECNKRAAELRDKLLFKQPESSHLGDCPICSVPLPLDMSKSILTGCCSKVICDGCRYAYIKRENEMMRLQPSCPFCREPLPKTMEESVERNMKRVEANDAVAIHHQGVMQYQQGNHARAFKYFTKAAELGNAEAHFKVADMYNHGRGVEKDWGKYKHHLEEAAIGGHPDARYDLGAYEWNNGDKERAVKHWIISATQGQDESIKIILMKAFRKGLVEKDAVAVALRAHKAAVDAMKSSQREEAEAFYRENEYLR